MPRFKRWLLLLAALVILVVLAALATHRFLRARHHPGLPTFLRQLVVNYPRSFAVEPPVLEIDVEEADLEQLKAVVEAARDRGVILPEGNPYVKGRFRFGDAAFKGKLRIKGKLTDHVEGRKWSFRILASKDGGMLGMKRFSVQHPGTRHYLYDWLYHQLSAGEGIVALRYGFIRVRFNGDDMGIYAYEEHFGQELLDHNGRVRGPLLRFDPGLFWEQRLRWMEGRSIEVAEGTYQAAAVDPFDGNELARDAEGRHQLEAAVALLDGFRTGRLPASAVFDADKIGRRHALLDLMGGFRSMDWSDVKYYYDPVARRIEPVSYESTAPDRIRRLAGAYRFSAAPRENMDLHDQLFSDPGVFAAYVHHLERVARPAYLDSSLTALKGVLDTASATLYREFPYKELDPSIFRANQAAIRDLLRIPRVCHAYVQQLQDDSLVLALVPVGALPVRIDSVVLPDGRSIAPQQPVILPCRPEGKVGRPVMLRLHVPGAGELDRTKLSLRGRVLGAATDRRDPVIPFAWLEDGPAFAAASVPTVDRFPFIAVDHDARQVLIRPGTWTIAGDLVLPDGYTCLARAPLKLTFTAGARLRGRAALDLRGEADGPIELHGARIQLMGNAPPSQLRHVRFQALDGGDARAALVWHGAPVVFTDCSFQGTGGRMLALSMGRATLERVLFTGGHDQLRAEHVEMELRDARFDGAGDDALSLRGGVINGRQVRISGAGGIPLKVSVAAQVRLQQLSIAGSRKGIDAVDGARVAVDGGRISAADVAVHAGAGGARLGPVLIELRQVEVEGGEQRIQRGEGSTVLLDGRETAPRP